MDVAGEKKKTSALWYSIGLVWYFRPLCRGITGHFGNERSVDTLFGGVSHLAYLGVLAQQPSETGQAAKKREWLVRRGQANAAWCLPPAVLGLSAAAQTAA